jgi:hypothetical protein
MIFKTTNDLQENILGLEDVSNWGASVFFYNKSHSTLQIRLGQNIEDSPEIKLEFISVQYFSGVLYWYGVNLRVHSNEDRITFLKQSVPAYWRHYEEHEKRNMLHLFNHNLYSFLTNEGNLIQIVASCSIHTPDDENSI